MYKEEDVVGGWGMGFGRLLLRNNNFRQSRKKRTMEIIPKYIYLPTAKTFLIVSLSLQMNFFLAGPLGIVFLHSRDVKKVLLNLGWLWWGDEHFPKLLCLPTHKSGLGGGAKMHWNGRVKASRWLPWQLN